MTDRIYEIEYFYRLEKVESLKMLNVDVLHNTETEDPRNNPRYYPIGHTERVVGSLIVKKPHGEFELILAIQRKRWHRIS